MADPSRQWVKAQPGDRVFLHQRGDDGARGVVIGAPFFTRPGLEALVDVNGVIRPCVTLLWHLPRPCACGEVDLEAVYG